MKKAALKLFFRLAFKGQISTTNCSKLSQKLEVSDLCVSVLRGGDWSTLTHIHTHKCCVFRQANACLPMHLHQTPAEVDKWK